MSTEKARGNLRATHPVLLARTSGCPFDFTVLSFASMNTVHYGGHHEVFTHKKIFNLYRKLCCG